MTSRELAAIARRAVVLLLFAALTPPVLLVARELSQPHRSIAMAKLLYVDAKAPAAGHAAEGAPQPAADLLNSEREMIATPSVAAELARQFGAPALAPELPTTAGEERIDAAILQHLAIRPVPASRVVELWFEAGAPRLATDALDFVIRRHLDRRARAFGASDDPRGRLAAELAELDRQAADYKSAHDYFDPESQHQTLLKTRADLTQEATRLRGQIADAQARFDDLKDQFAHAPVRVEQAPADAASGDDEALAAARTKLRQLRDQQREMTARDGAGSAAAKALDEQIDALAAFVRGKDAASAQPRGAHGKSRDDLADDMTRTQTELRPLTARLAAVDGQLAETATQLKTLDQVATRVAEFDRSRAELAAALKTATDRPSGAPAASDGAGDRFEPHVIQVPVVVGDSEAGDLAHAAILGAGLGIVLAGAVLAFVAGARRTLILPDSLERRYGLPVLTSLPARPAAR